MNKRSGIVSDEAIVAHIKNRYTYDAEKGTVVSARGRVIKGGVSTKGYLKLFLYIGGHRVEVRLHQVVWVLNHGRLPRMIDHINGDGHDNRIENLREVSYSENDSNRLLPWRPNRKTGLPGVCQNKDGRFVIYVFGKRLRFASKYCAFYHLTLFGRMFSVEERRREEEKEGRREV